MFGIPDYFWEKFDNVKEFFEWTGKILGVKNYDDWYLVTVVRPIDLIILPHFAETNIRTWRSYYFETDGTRTSLCQNGNFSFPYRKIRQYSFHQLVDLAKAQDVEVGDGTTTVTVLAGIYLFYLFFY